MGLLEQSANILAPRAAQQFVGATSTVAATVDLRLIGPQVNTVDSSVQKGPPGALRKYITITPVGADCYIAIGPTSASVGSISATQTGTNHANNALAIVVGRSVDYRLEDTDLFLGYVTASGTGFVNVYISSNR